MSKMMAMSGAHTGSQTLELPKLAEIMKEIPSISLLD